MNNTTTFSALEIFPQSEFLLCVLVNVTINGTVWGESAVNMPLDLPDVNPHLIPTMDTGI